MGGQLVAECCYHCRVPWSAALRAAAVPRLEALVEGRRLGWLCAACEGVAGAAWAFVDAARGRSPEAEIARTAVVGQVASCTALVLPTLAPGEWSAMSPFGQAARARH